MATNVSGIIIEGIAGTGKTSTLSALLKNRAWIERKFLSSLVLSEHHTLRVLENSSIADFTKGHNLSLLGNHLDYLENINSRLLSTDWLARDKSAQKVPFVIERFHFTQVYHYNHLQWSDVEEIDARLSKLNTTVFLLTISHDDIQQRIIDDYRKSGWQDYLKTLGNNDRDIKNHFIQKQDELIHLTEKSKLPIIRIDSSNLNTSEITQSILDEWGFLE